MVLSCGLNIAYWLICLSCAMAGVWWVDMVVCKTGAKGDGGGGGHGGEVYILRASGD